MKTKQLIAYTALIGSVVLAGAATLVQHSDPDQLPPIPTNTYDKKVKLVEARRQLVLADCPCRSVQRFHQRWRQRHRSVPRGELWLRF